MANNKLKNLYDQVFDQVYPQIKNQGRGVLYTVMHIILYAEQSLSTSICNYLNIKSSATLEDDKKIVEGLISNPNDLLNLNKFVKDKKMELYWIVITACTLTGAYSCYKYLEYKKEQKTTQKISDNTKSSQKLVTEPQSVTPPRQSLTAALCLVVPANAIGNLRKNSQINASEIEKLIDAASYFLCTSVEDANTTQQSLELTDEDIVNISEQKEIYVRINIADGEEIVGKKILYIIKRNLPTHGQGIVRELAGLKYLSGLEKFNRV
ncbi:MULTISPECIES: hypothetical protein [Nostoc]|uniref:Uncharacterized protein n=1 Tax=Nostoc paludosum FACHB-159 TaxID=2692908 RepID=A0ABR8KN75_9NOSO|nr:MULTISPECIES: hypothetical protein [Nostoc]MBD2683155.1 hypothetical protein [Nostoc sp. FACHB-857]MBD2739500.1 hypothetical protein [Nostoc paludosum FACHB-159]